MVSLPFDSKTPLIGVVHLGPLPGSPRYASPLEVIVDRALEDVRAYAGAGFDGIIVENFGDAPFFPDVVPPITVAALGVCVRAVVQAAGLPVGVNVLRNDARAALAVAAVTGASFIRVNIHVGAAVTDQGIIQGRAFETVRERAALAPHVAIVADVEVKHAASLGPRPIDEVARETVLRGLADALVVTGPSTGEPADLDRVAAVRLAVPDVPVLVGSGVTALTVAEVLENSDGAIVGTGVKRGGRTDASVDPALAHALVAQARKR